MALNFLLEHHEGVDQLLRARRAAGDVDINGDYLVDRDQGVVVGPLDADDIAGVSLLYPRGGFPVGYGSIGGQVTMGGQGVHLASVVAILPNGSAVGNLTNPDGTYKIDGLPPGNYWVYVHPLPPTANITWPLDANGNEVAASGPFVSTFYPGTWDPSQFKTIPIAQGASVGNIDF